MSRLPDFIVIGAAKAGTTSLCDDLARHPGVFITRPKEPEFFCRDEKYARGLNWYRSLFDAAQPHQLAGEGSTMYSNATAFPGVPERIRAATPDARLVYLVREPTARAHSFWVQKLKNQHNFGGDLDFPRTFEDALAAKPEIVTGSDYRFQLQRYLAVFPREQILVLLFEEYISDRPGTLRRLAEFLGFEPEPLLALDPVKSNESRAHYRDRARTSLAEDLKRHPAVRLARRVLPRALRQAALDRAYARAERDQRAPLELPEPLSPAMRARLWAELADSVGWLEDFLGRDLDIWRRRHTQASATP
ncbi:MAG: sulfotransferase domain-containing protein [Phycisphaerales bacterium]